MVLVSYPTERQLDDMRPVTGNNPAESKKDQTIRKMKSTCHLLLRTSADTLTFTGVDRNINGESVLFMTDSTYNSRNLQTEAAKLNSAGNNVII